MDMIGISKSPAWTDSVLSVCAASEKHACEDNHCEYCKEFREIFHIEEKIRKNKNVCKQAKNSMKNFQIRNIHLVILACPESVHRFVCLYFSLNVPMLGYASMTIT